MRGIDRILAALALTFAVGAGPVAASSGPEAAPQKVVSINLCTDQLAMLLAAPGQLHSVTHFAADPDSSAMADQARRFELNSGLAEEVYLMQPDLVIAGRFTSAATVSMLQRLGLEVAMFDPAYSLDDIRQNLAKMGTALGREAEAARLLADFDDRLAALSPAGTVRPRAALYGANGYTAGVNSLAGEILTAAGFTNIAEELGIGIGGFVALEVLAMTDPDMVITGRPYAVQGRADAVTDHPVVHAIREGRQTATMTDRDWVCGTPYVLRAIEALAGARHP